MTQSASAKCEIVLETHNAEGGNWRKRHKKQREEEAQSWKTFKPWKLETDR